MYMMVEGINLAVLEIYLIYKISEEIRYNYVGLHEIDLVTYYWLMFTIMTGIWEFTFVSHRKESTEVSRSLISRKEHVWTNNYSLDTLWPSKFALQFYGEYGAYADREYMIVKDDWSALIEGTHAFVCAIFSSAGCIELANNNNELFIKYILIAMSAQWMNSVLYIGQYMIQINEEYHINENRKEFPTGKYLIKRPFFYINVLWTAMPMYVIANNI